VGRGDLAEPVATTTAAWGAAIAQGATRRGGGKAQGGMAWEGGGGRVGREVEGVVWGVDSLSDRSDEGLKKATTQGLSSQGPANREGRGQPQASARGPAN